MRGASLKFGRPTKISAGVKKLAEAKGLDVAAFVDAYHADRGTNQRRGRT